jgi:hypothetical protein
MSVSHPAVGPLVGRSVPGAFHPRSPGFLSPPSGGTFTTESCFFGSFVPVAPVVGTTDWLTTPFVEEFDPGSGRTLAACLMHASRTVVFGRQWRTAEEHVGTCPWMGDNAPKGALIPHTLPCYGGGKPQGVQGVARGPSGGWWGNGLPSR